MRRQQSYENYTIDDGYINVNNNQLDKEGDFPINTLWCSKDLNSIANNQNIKQILIDILNKHYKSRVKALTSLSNIMTVSNDYNFNLDFIDQYAKYFYINNNCLCNILISNTDQIASGKVGNVFRLKLARKSLIIKQIKNVTLQKYLSLRIMKYNSEQYKYIINMNPSILYNLFNSDDNKKYILNIAGDNFSNQTCIHMILNTILENDNYVYQYDAFYCGNNGVYDGYNIMEEANGEDLSEYLAVSSNKIYGINSMIFSDILYQLLPTLQLLKTEHFGFVHADLKAKNIFVMIENGKPIYKLADFDKSSIYFRGIRFHNTSLTSKILPDMNNYITKMQDNIEYYHLNTLLTDVASYINYSLVGGLVQERIMFSPYGFYMSYDIYTLLFSLLMEPSVWIYFKNMWNDETLQDDNWRGWYNLWFDDDFENVMKYINDIHIKYTSYLDQNDIDNINKYQKKMRSLLNMNTIIAQNNWKLKVDIDKSYSYFLKNNKYKNISIGSKYSKYSIDAQIHISNDSHVCTNKCDKWCNTSKYSKQSFTGRYVYDWDYCS